MNQRKTNRREFMQGKSARDAFEDVVDSTLGAPDGTTSGGADVERSGARKGAGYLVEICRQAMACRFQVYLSVTQMAEAPDAAVEALDLVEKLEDQMTIYRDHSEICEINRRAAAGPVVTKPQLFALLEQAIALSDLTSGAFDITTTPLSRTWGFVRREGRFPTQEEVEQAMEHVGSRWVQLDSENKSIRFRRAGVEINLNAIGKGYALDCAGRVMRDAGLDSFLLHGGQSSVLAAGSRGGGANDDGGWLVALRHPLRTDQRLAEIVLKDGALGTSGSANQFFHYRGRRFSHVLDPRTGWPAEGVLSATVLAPTAAMADALSTACFVLGLEAVQQMVESRSDFAALMVCPGARRGSIELHPVGLTDNQWRRLS